MKLSDLFTTYFPQVTLILGAVASLGFYFIKRGYDLKSKKVEIKHSIFQQNKLDSIKSFFSEYISLERVFAKISTSKLVKREYTTAELDKMIIPGIDKFLSARMDLSLFLNDEEMSLFDVIADSIIEVHSIFMDAYFEEGNETVIQKTNKIYFNFSRVQQKNKMLLKDIVRKIYHSYLTEV